ncbi:MAG: ferritin family protein [Theionarchaea archaeon]|nr:ferritin family protein [Theionarchaea archaeon]MBU7000637.1 ferritin family protein [Theionarchaea archaeon]MBU7021980.1 ferritin family protein [Theionarchaea archaeon]MBU7035780.1 ferritin family protein [Theionarchaea archaeon]MBU7041368.1 ferritin family protein [Theionarchaea archaeon]
MENEAQILGTALELEEKGFKFYSEAAKKTENETGKKIFARLAKEEQEHIESLREKFSTLYPEKKHRDIPVFEVKVSMYSGEVEALKTGRDMEKESIAFYSEWARGTLQPLFASLIEFEKNHLELLEAELDYVLKTGYWFDYFESSLED